MVSMTHLAHQYFDEAAEKNPYKIACVFNDEKITYGDLRDYANQLAYMLKKAGVQRGDRVCFCLYKSINSIKTILGILKADAVYVPLDAFSPVERLNKIVKDAGPEVLLCAKDTLHLIKKISKKATKVICLGTKATEERINKEPKKNPEYQNTDIDLAYIFYTSGSTGAPKGVIISHRNLIGCAEWSVNEFKITSEDILSSHPPFHFDLSTFDIYACFKAGATLVIVPEKLSIFPGALFAYIEKHKITIWNSVPSLLSYVAKSAVLKHGRIPSVKKVFFNGEVFPTKYLAQWMETFPEKEFVNMYGPTEATVQCSFYRIKRVPKNLKKPVPIGKACSNAEIFAATDHGTKVRVGEEGELYIRGGGVGTGYWRNPEKTREAFVQNPFRKEKDIVYKTGDMVRLNKDGNYEFLGRIDHQVKYMGYRIELGEIESTLYSLSYIKEAAVVAYTEKDPTVIAAFIVLSSPRAQERIQSDLGKIVPIYMVPHRFYILSKLPKTSTGKVDRVSLKKKYAAKA